MHGAYVMQWGPWMHRSRSWLGKERAEREHANGRGGKQGCLLIACSCRHDGTPTEGAGLQLGLIPTWSEQA